MPLKSSSAKNAPSAKERPLKRAKIVDDVSSVNFTKSMLSSPPPATKSSKGKQKVRAPTPPKRQHSVAKQKSQKSLSTSLTPSVPSSSSPLPSTFKVIAGSYEKLLYGLEGSVSAPSSTDIIFSLKPIFIFPAHVSCVKAVAASPDGGKWLATGSADEIIKVWDLRRRREIGGLMHHEGSITHLNFPSRSHLLSASEDGTLSLFRARDWSVLRALKGHKGRINSVAVHPSGKVALSVGKDKTLRMWDLMRGRSSGSTKLGVEGELVRWSTTGSLLVVQHQKNIDIYSTDLSLLHTLIHPSRVQDVKFIQRTNGDGELLLVAAEDKKVTVYDVGADVNVAPRPVAHFVGHELKLWIPFASRSPFLPALPPRSSALSPLTEPSTFMIFFSVPAPSPNTDSSGKEQPSVVPVAVYDSKGSRLTCVTLADGEVAGALKAVGAKRKRSIDADHDDDESEEEEKEQWPLEGEEEEEEEEEREEEEEEQ